MQTIEQDELKWLSKHKKTIFLIDLENTNVAIFPILESMADPSAYYYVFTSKNTKTKDTLRNNIPTNRPCSFIECTVGENAMDFQLIATAGMLTTMYPKGTYVIVSDDKGYIPAVRLLQENRKHVFQYRPQFTTKPKPKEKIKLNPKEPHDYSPNKKQKKVITDCFEKRGLKNYAETTCSKMSWQKGDFMTALHTSIQQNGNVPNDIRSELYREIRHELKIRNLA